MQTILLKHTKKFCLLRSSRLLLQKMFANYCHTKIKQDLPWTTRIKPSSLSTGWSKTNVNQWPSTCTPLKITWTRRQPILIQIWLLSDHNVCNNNNNSANSNNTTTEEIAQGDNLPTEATAIDLPKTKVPTLPETVNSASTAKFSTTLKKNAAKELMIRNLVLMAKDNFTGQKSTISTLKMLNPQTIIPIMNLIRFFNQELHDSPHECSQCHSAIDFEFVYCVHRNVQ